MEKLKIFFKGWNLFEKIFTVASVILPITFAIIFKSQVLDCFVSIFLLVGLILTSKGKAVAHIIGIVSSALYGIVAFRAAYYGELILVFAINIPMSIFAFITWIKKLRRDDEKGQVVILNHIKKPELSILIASQIVMGFGYFFMLRAFNTEFLPVSTIAMITNIIGAYLLIRRDERNWYVWILNNIVTMSLWFYLVVRGQAEYMTLLLMKALCLTNNIYGTISWQKLRKTQKHQV